MRVEIVPQDKLMTLVHKIINDPDTESLINKFLRAGVMVRGKYEDTKVGTPHGGNPSHLKYLGFGFIKMGEKWEARPH